jgi:N-acetylglutamate synthase-like GNAT family acetyltransferase
MDIVMQKATLINVDAGNVEEEGFFCYMSKRGSEGHGNKMTWLQDRFAEGMRMKVFELPTRGYVEYIPGEYAWRPVYAKGYMFIHCLWVVGQSKKQGNATLLLEHVMHEAKAAGMKGVAMVTSKGNWLMGKMLLVKNGFESVDTAEPSFSLMVKKFGKAKSPYFAGDWERKAKEFGDGFTVLTTGQCPYLHDAVHMAEEIGHKLGIPCKVIYFHSAEEIREYSPSPYGTFCIVYNGKVLSHHYLRGNQFRAMMENISDT